MKLALLLSVTLMSCSPERFQSTPAPANTGANANDVQAADGSDPLSSSTSTGVGSDTGTDSSQGTSTSPGQSGSTSTQQQVLTATVTSTLTSTVTLPTATPQPPVAVVIDASPGSCVEEKSPNTTEFECSEGRVLVAASLIGFTGVNLMATAVGDYRKFGYCCFLKAGNTRVYASRSNTVPVPLQQTSVSTGVCPNPSDAVVGYGTTKTTAAAADFIRCGSLRLDKHIITEKRKLDSQFPRGDRGDFLGQGDIGYFQYCVPGMGTGGAFTQNLVMSGFQRGSAISSSDETRMHCREFQAQRIAE